MSYYISVTGLTLVSIWYLPSFLLYVLFVYWQARFTPGNKIVKLAKRDAFWVTYSIWETKDAMIQFRNSGAHARAMAYFRNSYKTQRFYSYESNVIPTMNEALDLWAEHGKRRGGGGRGIKES